MYRLLAGTAGALAIVAGLMVPGVPLEHSPQGGSIAVAVGHAHHSNSLDTASSAIPSAANPAVTDVAQATTRSRAAGAKAISSSIATSDCDGCSGQSTAFQVVYFDGSGAALADNTAAAWSSCAGCASSACRRSPCATDDGQQPGCCPERELHGVWNDIRGHSILDRRRIAPGPVGAGQEHDFPDPSAVGGPVGLLGSIGGAEGARAEGEGAG